MTNEDSIFPPNSMGYNSPSRILPVGSEDPIYQQATRESYFPIWSIAYDNEIGSAQGITPPITNAVDTRPKSLSSTSSGTDSLPLDSSSNELSKTLKDFSEYFGSDTDKSFAANILSSADTTMPLPLSQFGEVAVLTSGKSSDFKHRFSKMEPESELKIMQGTSSAELMLRPLGGWHVSHNDEEVLPAWCLMFSAIGMKAEHLIDNSDFIKLSTVNTDLKLRLQINNRREDVIGFHRKDAPLPVVIAETESTDDSSTLVATLPSGLVIKWNGHDNEGPLFEGSQARNFTNLRNNKVLPVGSSTQNLDGLSDADVEEVVVVFPTQPLLDPIYLVLPTFKEQAKFEIDPRNMFWPPYNPLAKGEDKWINVEYTSPITSIAVLSLEEAQEFYANLGGKDTVGNTKNFADLTKGSVEAYNTAKGLGGLGVKASTKNINGKDWVIIRDFRRHQQTLMKGNKWGANNPRVVQAGLGLNDLKGAARYAKHHVKFNAGIEVAFAVGINAADYILRDEATLAEFVGNSAGDIAKGFITLAGATLITATVPATVGVLVTGLIFTGVSFALGKALDSIDNNKGYSKEMTKALEKYFQ
ncbi:S-type pyocin domain-containing protein [Vibrio mexicanus]|uniref:S-type pyocin domain-containing protein n=1 Tax=Vibrio mexicanus TaxID=1004326 RepID=UPI000B1CED59|nr:S-type pyocin domain-containing protein [Vibrio mexicanus]